MELAVVAWMIGVVVVLLFIIRSLIAWSLAPFNRQLIRRLLIQRLLTALPGAVLLTETDDHLTLRLHEEVCTLQLEQVYRSCAGAPRRMGPVVRQTVAAITKAAQEAVGLTDGWEQQVMPMLARLDALPPDTVTLPFSEHLGIACVLPTDVAFRWVSYRDLLESGISEDTCQATAMRNLERSCNTLEIQAADALPDGRDRLLRFTTGDGFDATRLALPSLYQRFSPRFHDANLLVAVPTRDVLVMVSAEDPRHARWLAWFVRDELVQRPYPLDDTLYWVTESGVRPWQRADEVTEQPVSPAPSTWHDHHAPV
jgi:hypothetical protein